MRLGLLVALFSFVFDQISKYWVREDLLGGHGMIMVNDYFNIVTAWNTGVSFSMFNNFGIWGIVGLSLLALAIVGYLLWWMKHETSPLLQIALGLIVGGALGHVVDRVVLGAVFDFLDFHIGGSHWPAFNAADSFICIGAGLIIVESIMTRLKVKEAN